MPKILGIKDGTHEHRKAAVLQSGFWVYQPRFNEVYTILGDNMTETADDIAANTPDLPELLDGPRMGCYVRDVIPREIAKVRMNGTNRILWEVDVEWSSEIDPDRAAGGGDGNTPADLPPKISWDYEFINIVDTSDAQGNRLLTTPGEKIKYERPIPVHILNIKRYEEYPIDVLRNLKYGNTFNLTPVTGIGAPKGTGWLLPFTAGEPEIVDGQLYALVHYTIKFKMKESQVTPGTFLLDTWKDEILHEGVLYFKNPGDMAANIPPIQYIDKKTNAPGKVNLKVLNGTKLPVGAPPEYQTFYKAAYAEHNDLNWDLP